MNRRTLLGLFAALGTTSGCLGSHPLPPVRGRVVRTSVVGVRDGGDVEDVLLVVTPDAVDPGPEMVDARESAASAGGSSGGGDGGDGDEGDDGSSAPTFAVPPPVHDALLDRFDEVRYHLTVDHRTPVHVYGVAAGDRLRYRTRAEVFRRLVPADRTLFTVRPVGPPRFQNTNSVVREGAVRRKRLRVGPDGDLRTVLTATPDGTSRGDGPDLDVSLPVSEERLERLRDRFPTVRLAVDVEHAVGEEAFVRTYRADRTPFNRLAPGESGQFAVETVDTDAPGVVERISTLDPDSPFYDDRPW